MNIPFSTVNLQTGYVYTDPNTGASYVFDAKDNSWRNILPISKISTSGVISEYGQVPNSDVITTQKEAARFLRLTTMGPLLKEIDDLVELGSKSQWLANQFSSSFDNSEFSDWDSTADYAKHRAGWFGTIALRLQFPENFYDPDVTYSYTFPGEFFLYTVIQKGFIGNNTILDNVTFPNRKNVYGLFKQPQKSLLAKVTWILNKLIPVSMQGGAFETEIDSYLFINWYNTLSRYAFKNYVDLLEAVTYHPSMSIMLTHLRNRKSGTTGKQPDENYAREIMQLFTLGLHQLNPDGSYKLDARTGNRMLTYEIDDISQAANVFTGLTQWDFPAADYYDPSKEFNMTEGGNLQIPIRDGFLNEQTFYRTRRPASTIQIGNTYRIFSSGNTNFVSYGAPNNNPNTEFVASRSADSFVGNGVVERKIVYPRGVCSGLKHFIPWYETAEKKLPTVGITIPANVDPETNIRMFLEGLVNHPNCAPFVAKSLIKLAVTSNPSSSYVSRVAAVFKNNGKGVVGDLAAVWSAIFTDSEANMDIQSSTNNGVIKDGYEAYASLVRPFEGTSIIAPIANGGGGARAAIYIDKVFQTEVLVGLLRPNDYSLGAWPWRAPSIFSYYSPTFTTSPAREWNLIVPAIGSLSANTMMTVVNKLTNHMNSNDPLFFRRTPPQGLVDLDVYLPVYSNIFGDEFNRSDEASIKSLISKINLIMCGGNLNSNKVKSILETIKTMPVAIQDDRDSRVSVILQLMFRTPEFWIT